MIATPSARASAVGADVLRAGGSAVDAAIAAGALLVVAQPNQCGLGGDAFWLIRPPGADTIALDAAGPAPAAADPELLRAAGHTAMPERSPWTVTVPGLVDGWRAAHERFGRLPLERLLAPAIAAARDGVPVTPTVADALRSVADILAARPESRRLFPPNATRLVQPELAATLEAVARDPRVFYEGAPAAAMAAAVQAEDGWLAETDLAAFRAAWTTPLATGFAGWTVEEMPPPSQGVAALVGLRLLAAGGLPDTDDDDAWLARGVEAARRLMAVRDAEVADPTAMRRPAAELLADDFLARVPAAPVAHPGPPPAGDTVHLAVVDGDGLAVSSIQSVFDAFGSGIVAAGTGIVLHDRGESFRLEPGHVGELAPGRRPLHTLAPALATAGGRTAIVFGCMGGHAQAQIHLQLLSALARGLDPAAAVAAPRWFAFGDTVLAEDRDGLPARLRALGHPVTPVEPYAQVMGHANVVTTAPPAAAADPRSDGAALRT
jgi:gamma-glutamyltranspeptidase/glutathione hydrolase